MDPALAALMGLEADATEDETANDLEVAEARGSSDQILLDSQLSDQEGDVSDSGSAVVENYLSQPSLNRSDAKPIPSNAALRSRCVLETIRPHEEAEDSDTQILSSPITNPKALADRRGAKEENAQLNATEGTPKAANESSVGKLSEEEVKALEKKNRLDRLLALRNRFIAESGKGENRETVLSDDERDISSDMDPGASGDTRQKKEKSMASPTNFLLLSVSPENIRSASVESGASDSDQGSPKRRKSGRSGSNSPPVGSGRKSNKNPRKLKSASKRQLLEMHKESERLIRSANVSLNTRVVQKKGMTSFLEKFKCSAILSTTSQSTSKGKGKGPMISPIIRTQASTSKFTRSTPYLDNEDTDTGSSSDVEIVGGPGQIDPNAHLPKAQRVLAKIQPSRSTLMPPQARAALSGKQKYRELAGLKSPKRQPAPYSHDPATQSSADAVKAHNARLRIAIWEQAAMRRKNMEEEAKAKGIWRSQAEPELVDADVPREAVAFPMEETQKDDDYIPTSDEEEIFNSDYSSDECIHSDNDENQNMDDQRDNIGTENMEDNIQSANLTLGIGKGGFSSDEEEPLYVSRRVQIHKAVPDGNTSENKAKFQKGNSSEEDEVPLIVRRRTNLAPSNQPIARAGKGNDEHRRLPPVDSSFSQSKESVEGEQNILDEKKLSPEGFAALFASSNNLPAEVGEGDDDEGETQAWEKLRCKSPGSTLPYSMASAMFPPTIPCNPPSVHTGATIPNGSGTDLDEPNVSCEFPASNSVVVNEDDSQTTPSQYLNSQGLLTRIKPDSLRIDNDEIVTEKSGIRPISNSDEEEVNIKAPRRHRLKPRRERTRTETNDSDLPDSISQIPSSQNGYQVDHDSERSEDEDEDEEVAEGQEGLDSDSDISLTSARGNSVPRKRNAFFEEEAEEEEDEYMGLGGLDGDASDDDGEDLKDMIERRRIGEDELRANDVRDLHRKQLAEEEEKTVAQLMKDLDDVGGGLLRKRRGFDGGLGFGMESDSDDDGRSGRRRAGKRTKNDGPPNPLEEDPRTAAFARAQRGPADEDDAHDPFASDDDNSRLRVTVLGRMESTRDVIELEEERLEATAVKKSIQKEISVSQSLSFRLGAEEDDMDTIESQNSELLSLVNDRSLLARTHSAVVSSTQVQHPRRRLLGCSPSKLQRFRSMGSEEASGVNSSIGSRVRSRVADESTRITANKLQKKENIEPPPLRDVKGKGRMVDLDCDDLIQNPERRKRGGLLRLLEGRQGFEGDG